VTEWPAILPLRVDLSARVSAGDVPVSIEIGDGRRYVLVRCIDYHADERRYTTNVFEIGDRAAVVTTNDDMNPGRAPNTPRSTVPHNGWAPTGSGMCLGFAFIRMFCLRLASSVSRSRSQGLTLLAFSKWVTAAVTVTTSRIDRIPISANQNTVSWVGTHGTGECPKRPECNLASLADSKSCQFTNSIDR
jgi:hypothetical protein